MIEFMAPCPYCDEMFEDTDEYFIHLSTCEANDEGEDVE